MLLGTPKLGESYDFYANPRAKKIGLNAIHFSQTGLIVHGTIIAIMGDVFLCGFLSDSEGVSFKIAPYFKGSVYQDHLKRGMKTVSNFEKFMGATWVEAHYEIVGGPYSSAQSGSASLAQNNYTCPHCQNTRCSAPPVETKCWLCGGKL